MKERNIMGTDYGSLKNKAEELTKDVSFLISNLANISALIKESLSDINWAGFYVLEDETLILGPFQGKTASVTIPLGNGVCGTAAAEDKTLVVPDVKEFAGYIECDSATQSEIVIPMHCAGTLWGVLDIASTSKDYFKDEDKAGLEELVKLLEKVIFAEWEN